ncbi:uncharacterized protein CPUR_03075 [Claviceps purpurea 20.1]|uniref:F-box domain-containing protein n=1 Tax=Claviceps purpurea (strain 20.1) TaxID=1111077 RepID=M1VVE5_CLAP2|nr:uncharacterized protein CPUR_03075 [Claviceps purpurea 20.1]
MADLNRSGRHTYATAVKKRKRALVLFTKAMRCCPCARGAKRDRCTCKNFDRVVAEGRSIFREAMYTCHCDVGKAFGNCDNAQHIEALKSRSAMYEALGKLDRAKKDAEWMLELAPRLPDGYLRFGNIARLEKNDEYAWKMYTAGIEAIKETAVGSSPKLQQLLDARKPLYQRFFRRDPLSLPTEIVAHIFSYLEFTQLLFCLRVCKQWKRTLTSPVHCQLWRAMVFTDRLNKLAPSLDDVKWILSFAGDGGARKIKIASRTACSQSTLTLLLKRSSSLEHLEIWNLVKLSLPSNEKIWNQLKYVSFTTSAQNAVDGPGGFPQTFLQNAASTLEHLNFVGIPKQWYDSVGSIPLFTNLKTLRIGDHEKVQPEPFTDEEDDGEILPFPIFFLSIAFPNLEQLWIGPDVPYLGAELVETWQDKWEEVWPHLKVLIFNPRASTGDDPYAEDSRVTIRYLTCLKSLQHISLEFDDEFDDEGWPCMFSGSDDEFDDLFPDLDVTQHSEFKHLRSFRSSTMGLSPPGAWNMLSNAIKAEQLTSFDIVFPPGDGTGVLSIRHLEEYEWLRGASSIHTLGCYQYNLRSRSDNDEDWLLPHFLATFPNLRTLSLEPLSNWPIAEFARELLAILRVTHLKTIYLCTRLHCTDESMGQVRQAARDRGVELIEDRQEQQWPVPLKV